MKLSNAVREYIHAAFSGIYVQSHEHEDAIAELQGLCEANGWTWATWDISSGLNVMDVNSNQDDPDPVSVIRALRNLGHTDPTKATVLILSNFHRFMDSPEVIQALEIALKQGKSNRTFIVVLAPTLNLPIELQKKFVVVEHALPDRTEMEAVLNGVASESSDLPEDGPNHILDAAAGLTRTEAEGAFALSLVRYGKIKPQTVWEIKAAALKKSGLLRLHEGEEKFDNLGGLDNLKAFCKRALTQKHTNEHAKPKGVMLLGVPGSGKSAFAKALGNEVERPTITLDVGSLMGGLVGETERNTRRALEVIDAMAPCIVFVDEIEKSLAGATNGGQGDSGVGARMFGTLLSWLNDHTTDVFFIGTSNNISLLPPEFSRAERFDGIFFIDLPGPKQKEKIWDMYEDLFCVGRVQSGDKRIATRPTDTDWTGAEIRSCCRLAAMLDITLLQAAQNIVPVAITAGESVERLRNWASGRCLSSESPGLYHSPTVGAVATDQPTTKQARNIKRNPESN